MLKQITEIQTKNDAKGRMYFIVIGLNSEDNETANTFYYNDIAKEYEDKNGKVVIEKDTPHEHTITYNSFMDYYNKIGDYGRELVLKNYINYITKK